MTRLDDLYLPDRKRLSSMIVGRPGAGKSFFLEHTIREFMRRNQDENFRLIYICPKNEMTLYDKEKPIPPDKLERHLRKNRTAVVYPDADFVEAEVDYCIDLCFAIQQANPDFTCTICLDDAQTFIQSRKSASAALRRLALTGRSKGIRFVPVSHQMVFSKDLEGSTSFIVFFSMPVKLYQKDALTRYGFDAEPHIERMAQQPYSFVWFDVTRASSTLMMPLDIKAKGAGRGKAAPQPEAAPDPQ
jgi:hypothetical protein